MTDVMQGTATHDRYAAAEALLSRKRLMAFLVPGAVLAYLVYILFAFDIPGLAQRADLENGRTLIRDAYSYKTHVTRDNRSGDVSVSIEGERKGDYPDGTAPDWVALGEETVVTLPRGHEVRFLPGNALVYDFPEGDPRADIEARIEDRGVVTDIGEAVPAHVSLSSSRLNITTEAGRVSLTNNRTEVFRYFTGWELFFFTLDSPYHGHSFWSIAFGERIDPERANIAGAASDFWNNAMWRHKDVAWAIFETILMAFLGTAGAALIALPLAFVAARNFSRLWAARFGVRRIFDFVRGVDGLIWTIVLSRAFGPGPLTGALAILLTDTGTFGKLFSETLENVDSKQIEGVQSTGAKKLQRYRFGVLPQVIPVFLSQGLYMLESNTRSATIIGAITGGGIGLLLTQAIITQKDWEEVTYYIVLIILMVMFMDSVSSWLRNKLIRGE